MPWLTLADYHARRGGDTVSRRRLAEIGLSDAAEQDAAVISALPVAEARVSALLLPRYRATLPETPETSPIRLQDLAARTAWHHLIETHASYTGETFALEKMALEKELKAVQMGHDSLGLDGGTHPVEDTRTEVLPYRRDPVPFTRARLADDLVPGRARQGGSW